MRFLNLFILITFIYACSSDKPEGKTEAEVLYKEALELVEDERYLMATEKLNKLKNQYPYSIYATPGELLQAEIFFKQENFIEAAAAFLIFKDFHPKHEKIDYVVFQIGNSYYNQIPDTYDRDLTPAVEAVKYFKDLQDRYPTSKYIAESKTKQKECAKLLEKKQQYIADFYFKTDNYFAARWRYLDILENFSNTKLRNHAMERIVLASYHLEEYEQCYDYYTKYKSRIKSREEVSEVVSECQVKAIKKSGKSS